MSLGDHDTFSMHGCPVAVCRTFLPTDDAPLRRAIIGAGYPIIAGEGATETAIYLLGGVRHLRHGLTERGIPIGTRAGFAAAPSTAALAEIDRLRAVGRELADGLGDRGVPLGGAHPVDAALRKIATLQADAYSLDRLLDEHGRRGENETLPDAVKRVLRVVDDCYHVASAHGRHAGEAPADAFARMFAERKAEIAGLRSDVRAAERATGALERTVAEQTAAIIALRRRIEELRVAGESLSTLSGQLSAVEADLAREKARAAESDAGHRQTIDGLWTRIANGDMHNDKLHARTAKAEAEVDRLRENARTTQTHANIATCLGNGFVDAMEANGVPLHDQNPLGLRRVLATRAALEARAEKAEAEVARLSAPVDDDTIAVAMRAIGLALRDANYSFAGNALCDGYASIGDATLRGGVAGILRSLARQAPSAAAKDEGERLRAGIDAALAEIEQEASGRRARARQFAAQLLPDYSAAVELDGNAYGFTRSAAIVRNHVDKP